VEEPLEIRISGEPVMTTLRTPGQDRELALGYLFGGGSIEDLAAVSGVAHCGRADSVDYGNVLEVTPSPGVTLARDPLARLRPTEVVSSACGVCGRAQILELAARCCSLEADRTELSSDAVLACCQALTETQAHFVGTGGLHAAAVLSPTAEVVACAEDVGRHNAVDKVVGMLLLQGRLPASEHVLVVTSRASFEIVQKACVASIPIVICLSAPTSLAIETATAFGMTLVGFVRDGAFNVYAGAHRIR
jgi:FdhD protein